MAGPGTIFAFGIVLMAFIFKNIIKGNQGGVKIKDLDSKLMEFGKPGDVFVYLMLLTAHFIKLDGRIDRKEKDFVHEQLFNTLPPEIAKSGVGIIQKVYNIDLSALIEAMDLKAKATLSYSTKLNMLHYLRRLCVVDKVFSEEKELKVLAGRLGVSMYDYDKIATLSYNNKLNPESILKEQEMLNQQDLKIAEYLIFNKFLGEADDPYMNNLSYSPEPTSFVPLDQDNIASSEELTTKIEKIEKEIREKTFDDRIDEFKDERIKQQIAVLDKKLHLFLDVLSQKMEPGEITYLKYKKTFEQVYMMALKNIKEVVASQKIIESIDKEKLKEDLEQLRKAGRKQHVKTKQERLKLFEEETNRLNEILLNNERAIQEMEEVTFEIGRLKGTKGEDQRAIKQAIQDLDEWTDKVKLYDKR
jgi:hypothetical protein